MTCKCHSPTHGIRLRIIFNQSKVSLNQKRQRKDWLIRHIPVKVKGRSPRPYRVPKLISSIVMGVCLYLAVHLNAGPRYQNDILLRRGERDLSGDIDYFAYYSTYQVQFNNSLVDYGYPPTRNVVGPMVGNVVNMEHTRTSNP
jgi:hypothetical protein